MSSTECWPVDKIASNLGHAPRGRRCVLLTTGALNPVHLGHVAMFDRARDTLESEYGSDDPFSYISSTRVREALARNDIPTLQSWLHPDVLAMLLRWR